MVFVPSYLVVLKNTMNRDRSQWLLLLLSDYTMEISKYFVTFTVSECGFGLEILSGNYKTSTGTQTEVLITQVWEKFNAYNYILRLKWIRLTVAQCQLVECFPSAWQIKVSVQFLLISVLLGFSFV